MKQLREMSPEFPRGLFLVPFSLNMNSVTLRVMSRTNDRQWLFSESKPKRWMLRLPNEVILDVFGDGTSSQPRGIPHVEPNVLQ